ncbi:hypothetical protein VTN02DRAFT_4642 [Thermoascus thermophilus]
MQISELLDHIHRISHPAHDEESPLPTAQWAIILSTSRFRDCGGSRDVVVDEHHVRSAAHAQHACIPDGRKRSRGRIDDDLDRAVLMRCDLVCLSVGFRSDDVMSSDPAFSIRRSIRSSQACKLFSMRIPHVQAMGSCAESSVDQVLEKPWSCL